MVHDQYVSSTGKIPEEAKALSLLAPATPVASLMPGGGLLPIPTPAPLQNLGIPISNLGAMQSGLDSSVAALSGVSAQPPIMGNVDPSKIDEIRRTVYVGNLNSQTTTAEQLLEYFKQVGDVKFVRMAGDETQPTRFAFVEFADQESVSRALTFNGVMFGDRPLKINHSNNAIVKPPELTPQGAAKELEEVMKRVREAQSTIAAAIEPGDDSGKKRSTTSSRRLRRSRSRSRSRSQSRRKRSRSRHRSRPSTKSRSKIGESHGSRASHKKRSRSRDRRHSRSRSRSRDRRKEKEGKTRAKEESSRDKEDRKPKDKKGKTPPKSYSASRRSRSTSRGHRRRSRSRSKTPRRKMKSPSPKRGKKDKKRDKVRDSSRERSDRDRSRRSGRDEEKAERRSKGGKVRAAAVCRGLLAQHAERDSDKEKTYESEREGSLPAGEEMTSQLQHNGSYSKHGEDTACTVVDDQ
ncbi:splicing regulatory glutamine/lysine-rich protein 1 isoform X3 [Brienomyrus brachyistius]|uniref:splicing regulatory glutamine/lysine-rich protein 1 isoform X3 n=1 Tax=Brienomyrus brachyistius TaxID=42636 RepID=UPI0020B2158E|nr:splicing regulatory glutamine/lysine-rich protein 1 isoform X3 [Brienomyrus brachyistius]XP_048875502.1 splicing regulatory glutamine/lysine-rich protein 1 isoform X3 [Brienomyrus brachyistius]